MRPWQQCHEADGVEFVDQASLLATHLAQTLTEHSRAQGTARHAKDTELFSRIKVFLGLKAPQREAHALKECPMLDSGSVV